MDAVSFFLGCVVVLLLIMGGISGFLLGVYSMKWGLEKEGYSVKVINSRWVVKEMEVN